MAQSCDNYDTAYFRLVSVLEQALMTSVARRSFLRPREDFRQVKERFARGSGTNEYQYQYQCQTPLRPLISSRCSRLHTFPRAKKHSCPGANKERVLTKLVCVA